MSLQTSQPSSKSHQTKQTQEEEEEENKVDKNNSKKSAAPYREDIYNLIIPHNLTISASLHHLHSYKPFNLYPSVVIPHNLTISPYYSPSTFL
ncbi:hypothetical protein E2C01_031872 [Portunus trituberculatus]|uniref:Uncharacterized protein n=1 Tax=Portunus trituberculatus TaxID=210409 RepID=A0A5B7EZ16_PORTR|nr:hypothetical protein [Portunus trituberculatus]